MRRDSKREERGGRGVHGGVSAGRHDAPGKEGGASVEARLTRFGGPSRVRRGTADALVSIAVLLHAC